MVLASKNSQANKPSGPKPRTTIWTLKLFRVAIAFLVPNPKSCLRGHQKGAPVQMGFIIFVSDLDCFILVQSATLLGWLIAFLVPNPKSRPRGCQKGASVEMGFILFVSDLDCFVLAQAATLLGCLSFLCPESESSSSRSSRGSSRNGVYPFRFWFRLFRSSTVGYSTEMT
jgi:hypothetical protein